MCHTLRRLGQQRWQATIFGRIKIALTRFSSIGVGGLNIPSEPSTPYGRLNCVATLKPVA
jgi:hypothetical protein